MAMLTGAIIEEQGVKFAIAIVKDQVIEDQAMASRQLVNVGQLLQCRLVVLMGNENRRLIGNRDDIVSFASTLSSDQIPWKQYQIN